ncbi:MAG: DUF4164 domain-containing protein [Rhizobiaceae bacterium]
MHKTTQSGESANTALATSLSRLNKALDSLENAVDASIEANSKNRNAGEEIQRISEDRAKLAQNLDGAEERARRLAETNKEVSRRLVAAMETVRGVLDRPE